jgi:mannose-6-phosphate isomerase-like protein (cupin superfamily)
MSTFIPLADVRREQFDWGVIGWRLVPASGAKHLVVMDVELQPGGGHEFHRHPGQEEMIIVKEGTVIQFVGEESSTLTAGDSVFIPEGTVHGSVQRRGPDRAPAGVISPSLGGETGYGLESVADQEPWASLRRTSST